MAFRILLDIVIVALAAWFWPQCARPALTAARAAPAATWLVLGTTILTVVVYSLGAAAEIARIGGAARWWITTIIGVLWALIVGLGYFQKYALLLRLTGKGGPPRSN
jgi:predicted ABC-type sugar transport system permease subunit